MANTSLFSNEWIVIGILAITILVTIKLTRLTARLRRLQSVDAPDNLNEGSIEPAEPYKLIKARHGWMLANPNDFYLGRSIVEYGESGELESQFLAGLLELRPGKVIEIGANIGTHSVPLAKALALQNRELLVFEPQQFLFQNLCANLALSGLANVTAWPWACGAKKETVYFAPQDYSAPGNFGGVSMGGKTHEESVAVHCVRLDEVVDPSSVSLIKIDVEGYELLALQGAVGVLKHSRPVVYIENDRIEKSQSLIEWLWSQNYRLFWHCPPLFNSDNFFRNDANIYKTIVSSNMLALPKELEIPVYGMDEVTDAAYHPFRK